MLDGDSTFPLLASQHLFLSIDDKLPEAVIVGIAYGGFDPSVNKRSVDYTPPSTEVQGAGAPAFARFLRNELLPRIESRFAVDPTRRVLVGQSRGGTFVLYSAFAEPDLFWGRIASNPSFSGTGDVFYQSPAKANLQDLHLVIVSGTANSPQGRSDALKWLSAWQARHDKPWILHEVTLEGGTHSAYLADAYRSGMRLLFKGQEKPAETAPDHPGLAR